MWPCQTNDASHCVCVFCVQSVNFHLASSTNSNCANVFCSVFMNAFLFLLFSRLQNCLVPEAIARHGLATRHRR